MNFEWSDEELAFQRQVRAFISEHATPGSVADPTREGMAQLVDTPERRAFMRAMSERGWIGMSWPKEYGGGDAPGVYEYRLNEELAAVGAPFIGKGVDIVGKTIIRHGNERLKREFLPKIDMPIDAVLETIRLFGRHVIPKYDRDPVHRSARFRDAAAIGALSAAEGERR
ncbi:MAG: acyl-CoA dehydrogenase family protein [Actinomycetota bacterium]